MGGSQLIPAATATPTIDLNADLGESFGIWRMGDDAALLDVVTSANVACGFHAGDPATMRATCEAAAARGVAIGAHVAYPDLVGFGRRRLDIAADELRDVVLYQLGALDGFARRAGSRVVHVKPHGALYHAVHVDAEQAGAVLAAVTAFDPALTLVTAPGSALARLAADAGVAVAHEAFADRGYLADGALVPRGRPGALVEDPAEVGERAVAFATRGEVIAVDGSRVSLTPATICVHGDSPGAVAHARAVRDALEAAGVAVRPIAG
jgi:UPF0271 protein